MQMQLQFRAWSPEGPVQRESELRFSMFQSIDTAWDNSIVY